MKKILSFLTGRMFLFGFSILIQASILVVAITYLSRYGLYTYALFTLMSVITILAIVSKKDNAAYKLAWVLPVALFPIFGWLLYFILGRNNINKVRIDRIRAIYDKVAQHMPEQDHLIEKLAAQDEKIALQVSYVKNTSRYPVYENTVAKYLSPGEKFFEVLCHELEKAEHFIFMEYFIVERGEMWDTILEILVRKASQGVEVKMMYDDLGCVSTLPTNYFKTLRKMGIDVHSFNAFTPSLDIFMNYRDHRKITVIDGNVGFTGGNNLADEYINAFVKHGYWKDSSIMIKGDAVLSLSAMFLQMWQYYDDDEIEYSRYIPTKHEQTDGFVMPYCDGPLDQHLIGENIYIGMITNAKKYISITTPYLILDGEMTRALCVAAQSGVDVRIITPGVADKWYVHMVSRYNYCTLISAGVKIYEYTGAFMHSKTIVCDDEVAVVGTQNFDFRSFYLHFECGIYLYKSSTIAAVRDDHLDMFPKCHLMTMEDCYSRNVFVRILQSCLNLFSPLM